MDFVTSVPGRTVDVISFGTRRSAQIIRQAVPWSGPSKEDAAKSQRARDAMWIGDVVEAVSTGDVILFSSKHATSKIAKTFTNSRWDHVGIIIKPSPNRAYTVEWAAGLFAADLVERLNEFAECDGLELIVRRLNYSEPNVRAVAQDRMEKFVDMLFRENKGQNAIIPMRQIFKAARDQVPHY